MNLLIKLHVFSALNSVSMSVEEQSLPNCIAAYLQGVQLLWLSCLAHVRTTFLCVLHSDPLLMPTELTHIKLSSLVLHVALSTSRDFKVPWWPAVLRFVVVFSTSRILQQCHRLFISRYFKVTVHWSRYLIWTTARCVK